MSPHLPAVSRPNSSDVKAYPELPIETAARLALRAAGHYALSALDCRLIDGSLVISGTVSSYYLKQVAQTAVLRAATSWRVRNCVNVRGRLDINT